jgi:NADPH-dependent 7-cyano-7-deazaguanine reductase QueF-like protein
VTTIDQAFIKEAVDDISELARQLETNRTSLGITRDQIGVTTLYIWTVLELSHAIRTGLTRKG